MPVTDPRAELHPGTSGHTRLPCSPIPRPPPLPASTTASLLLGDDSFQLLYRSLSREPFLSQRVFSMRYPLSPGPELATGPPIFFPSLPLFQEKQNDSVSPLISGVRGAQNLHPATIVIFLKQTM